MKVPSPGDRLLRARGGAEDTHASAVRKPAPDAFAIQGNLSDDQNADHRRPPSPWFAAGAIRSGRWARFARSFLLLTRRTYYVCGEMSTFGQLLDELRGPT